MIRHFLLMILMLSIVFPATAEPIKLLHQPIPVENLPSPGRSFVLSVHVLNTRSPHLPVRALINRDGKIMDVVLRLKTFDKGDRLVYAAQVPAPRRSLSYQFALSNQDGSIFKTESYNLTRSCSTQTQLTEYSGTPLSPNREDGLSALITQARGLERDVDQYEFLVRQLEAMKEALQR